MLRILTQNHSPEQLLQRQKNFFVPLKQVGEAAECDRFPR
jgi:hypothetical protein